MHTERETDTAGRRRIFAPTGTMSGGNTSAVVSVWLNDGEKVDWHWCFTPEGSYVCGYTIIKDGQKEESHPMGGFVPPIRVQITEQTSEWKGECGIIERGIPENGCFDISLDSGMKVAFGPGEFKAVSTANNT